MEVLPGIGKPIENSISKSKTMMESSEVEPIPQVHSQIALERKQLSAST